MADKQPSAEELRRNHGFKTDYEKRKWLGEMNKEMPQFSGVISALGAASNAFTPLQLRKLQKALERDNKKIVEKATKETDKKVSHALGQALEKHDKKKGTKRKSASEKKQVHEDVIRPLIKSLADEQKKNDKEKEAKFKREKVAQVLAIRDAIKQMQLEQFQGNSKTKAKRQQELQEVLRKANAMNDSVSATEVAALRKDIDELAGKLTQNGAERIEEAYEKMFGRAQELNEKVEERWKARETKLKEWHSEQQESMKEFKKRALNAVTFGGYGAVTGAIDKVRSIKSGVSTYLQNRKAWKQYSQTGTLAGMGSRSLSIPSTTTSAPLALPNPTASLEDIATNPFRSATSSKEHLRKVVGELKKIGDAVKAASSGAASSLPGIMDGLGKQITSSLGGMLPSLLKGLSAAGAVAGAGALGWKAGEAINNLNYKIGNPIGNAVDSTMNFLTGKKAYDPNEGMPKGGWGGKKAATASTVAAPASLPPAGGSSTTFEQASTPTSSAATGSDGSAAPAAAAGSFAAGSGKMSDYIGKLFKLNGSDVDVSGMQPGFAKNFIGMAQEYKEQTGKTLAVNSAFRDNAKQQELYDQNIASGGKKKVAKPGTSLHNYGMAIDVNSTDGNALDSMGLLKKFGFSRPVKGEPWHIQPVGVSLAAAKQGVFSADFPSDQGTNGTGQSGGNTSAVSDAFSAPPASVAETAGGDSAASGGKGGNVSGGVAGVGVNSIPLFTCVDGTLLAMNMSALG